MILMRREISPQRKEGGENRRVNVLPQRRQDARECSGASIEYWALIIEYYALNKGNTQYSIFNDQGSIAPLRFLSGFAWNLTAEMYR